MKFYWSPVAGTLTTKIPVPLPGWEPQQYILASSNGTWMWRHIQIAFLTVRCKRSIDICAILICSCSSTTSDCNSKFQWSRSQLQQHINIIVSVFSVHVCDCITKLNWGEPEQAPHLSNGVPHDLCIYVYLVCHSVNKCPLWTTSILQCVINSVNVTTFKQLRLLQFCTCNDDDEEPVNVVANATHNTTQLGHSPLSQPTTATVS